VDMTGASAMGQEEMAEVPIGTLSVPSITCQRRSDPLKPGTGIPGDAPDPSKHLGGVERDAGFEDRVDVDPVFRAVEDRLADDEMFRRQDRDG